MLYGGYNHNIDKKGRLAIPAKLREQLGETFMICRGVYGQMCLCVFSQENWKNFVEKIGQLPNAKASMYKRFLYEGTYEVSFDSQGRILIPATLREYAGLDVETHIIGMDTNLEIWSSDIWNKEDSQYSPSAIASIVADLEF